MRALPPGVYVQCYRGKLPGGTHQEKLDLAAGKLDALKAAGIAGVAWHGFSSELTPAIYADYAKLCEARGLGHFPVFGMDATVPAAKGERLARLALLPGVLAAGVDAEGAYDLHQQAAALAMGRAFRAVAPDALVIDQSWPVPTVHMGFPYEQFAEFPDAHGNYVEFIDLHAEQRYYQDWKPAYGVHRYAKCNETFDKSEARLDALLPARARRPHILTIQGAGWQDIEGDLDDCLATHDTMIVWCEPWPDDHFVSRLRARLPRAA